MRATGWIFAGLATFVGLLGALYWFASGYEPAGSALLLLSSGLLSIVATYLLVVTNRRPLPPEDRDDATRADGAEVIGFFSPDSIWPFLVGLSASVLALGVPFGATPFWVGFALLALTGYALVTEHWRR